MYVVAVPKRPRLNRPSCCGSDALNDFEVPAPTAPMDVRPAESGDHSRIEEIVRQSFQTSYALSPEQINAIAEAVFSGEALAERADDDDYRVFVADGDKEGEPMVVGVAIVEFGDEAVLRWLHVEPGARGRGTGTALFERAQEEAAEAGVPLTVHVLEAASEGGEFPERFGYNEADTVEVDVGGETFHAQVLREGGQKHEANEPQVEVPDAVDEGGETRPVDRNEEVPGSEAPFFPVYSDEEREDRWGYFCSNCGSTDVSGDNLDRLECGNCGNTHRADEWDSAYL